MLLTLSRLGLVRNQLKEQQVNNKKTHWCNSVAAHCRALHSSCRKKALSIAAALRALQPPSFVPPFCFFSLPPDPLVSGSSYSSDASASQYVSALSVVSSTLTLFHFSLFLFFSFLLYSLLFFLFFSFLLVFILFYFCSCFFLFFSHPLMLRADSHPCCWPRSPTDNSWWGSRHHKWYWGLNLGWFSARWVLYPVQRLSLSLCLLVLLTHSLDSVITFFVNSFFLLGLGFIPRGAQKAWEPLHHFWASWTGSSVQVSENVVLLEAVVLGRPPGHHDSTWGSPEPHLETLRRLHSFRMKLWMKPGPLHVVVDC